MTGIKFKLQKNRTMKKVENWQIQKIHIHLRLMLMGTDKDFKRDLVQQFTNNRETSTTGLTYDEANRMIDALREKSDSSNTMRRKILHYAHSMNWQKPGT